MISRTLLVLMVLSLGITVAGCEGDTGPAGPAGADGAGVLAWAEVDGSPPNSEVTNKWPGNVAISSTRNNTGDYTVQLTGSFPVAEGVVIAGVHTGSTVAVSSEVTAWSNATISIDVEAWNTGTDSPADVQFSLVVFEAD